ncbi:MAG: hypothetical protein IT472_00825 [Thermomonas sp.]|uniref:hypothetical protein n=1 Tax=Thermomonas sp. TaxID=1971895 RepID=UPI00262CCE2C|nr:hypothetical protein [Thermomonas sp.]MCC7095713.1 hypothetical protein [Thermomonas sp.]
MHSCCPTCPCASNHPAHAVLIALGEDDLDAALALGLLDAQPCPGCAAACNAALVAMREARRFALAARGRHRARAARLGRIQRERDAARSPRQVPDATSTPTPALPSVAAEALARALAKAKARHS